ncbi:MAG: hypothetical protein JWM53_6789 [bacterium]|nr:hypothetical protein [bacterium]
MTMTTASRDALHALITYNRQFVGDGRDPAWLRLKLDRLCASPFGFLRGTFHLFVADWATFGDDPLAAGGDQPIVGDLHLENFGAFRAADGSVVFDVNDFDETASFTPALDLARLATSLVLADERHGDARAVERVGALVESWCAAARALDLRPISGKDAPPVVRALVESADDAARAPWLERRAEGGATERRFKSSEKYQPVTDPRLRASIIEGVRAFGARCAERPPEIPDWPRVLDVAVRVAGTGSLGRFRWAILAQAKSEKVGKERILELKEALPSSLSSAESAGDAADRVIATQRRLQGAPPAFLGVAHVDGRAFTVRELQPTEAKLDSGALKGGDLDALAAACGTVLGRLHRRAGAGLPDRIAGRERTIARRVAAFALRYADQVSSDYVRLRAERSTVEQGLGLAPSGGL